MPSPKQLPIALAALTFALAACTHAAPLAERPAVERVVDATIRPLLAEHDVPGMAVAVAIRGQRYAFYYGVAARQQPLRAVDADTLFEIGSVSKTFTTTLACYAAERGTLSLADPSSRHLPALLGSSFDRIRLLDLATYTAGGLPLQYPEGVASEAAMLAWFRTWIPDHPPGTQRLYSNPSIGLLGHLTARSLGRPFAELLEQDLLPQLGMHDTYVQVPAARLPHYAHGHRDGALVRVNPGLLDAETYGVKTTAADLLRFVEANLRDLAADGPLRRAIAATHTGYYTVGGMVQGLGWEMYPYPTELDTLLAGNSPTMLFTAQAVTPLVPPQPPRADMLLQKTGSTNGFGAYVAFVPARDLGIVLLANRSYPIEARVRAAFAILTALDPPNGNRDPR